MTFGNLVVNGKPVEVASAEAVYPEGVPDYADAVAKANQLVGDRRRQAGRRQVEADGSAHPW